MISAIIIDDEPYCCETLSMLLERYCPEVKVIGVYHQAHHALREIPQLQPQLVFLDIEMPQMNGFDMLSQLKEIHFDLVFTTSYDQYAIKAIRFSALDYLLKPIDREELQKAVQKVLERRQPPMPDQLTLLLEKLQQTPSRLSKIAMPTMEGLQMIAVDDIISCTAQSNYTVLNIRSRHNLIVSRTLKEVEELLAEFSFLRVHHSYLVNLNEVEKYIKGEGGYLLMSDGSTIDVSRSKKELLLKKLLPNRI